VADHLHADVAGIAQVLHDVIQPAPVGGGQFGGETGKARPEHDHATNLVRCLQTGFAALRWQHDTLTGHLDREHGVDGMHAIGRIRHRHQLPLQHMHAGRQCRQREVRARGPVQTQAARLQGQRRRQFHGELATVQCRLGMINLQAEMQASVCLLRSERCAQLTRLLDHAEMLRTAQADHEIFLPQRAALHVDKARAHIAGGARVARTIEDFAALGQAVLVQLQDMAARTQVVEMPAAAGIGQHIAAVFKVEARTGHRLRARQVFGGTAFGGTHATGEQRTAAHQVLAHTDGGTRLVITDCP